MQENTQYRDASKVRDKEIMIDVKGFWQLVKKNIIVILLSGVVLASLVFGYFNFFVTPIYTSSSKIFIMSSSTTTAGDTKITSSDIVVSEGLINDYQVLITSRSVAEEVISELDLSMSPDQLISKTSVAAINESRVISISVNDTDPKMAQTLSNKITEVAIEHIKNVMDVELANLVDSADLPTAPTSPTVKKNTILGFGTGIVLCVVVLLIRFVLDDKLKNKEDIEKVLGLNVMGIIPEKNQAKRRRDGGRRNE